ncbi:tRNA (adenosine(37)-N6)-threonylcarbamoyltransferase complex dimerization subunit type 1 TsaB [Patescibacteria group bacterium]
MIILGLNTATNISQIALVKDNEILAEDSWKSEQNEAETLLPNIKKMFNSVDLDWKDIDKIAVIKGPGPFTALRVSIAVANGIAYALGIPVWGIPVQDYWKLAFNGDFVLQAGLNRVFYKDKLVDFDDFLDQAKGKVTGHLKESQIAQLKAKGVEFLDESVLGTPGVLGNLLKTATYNDEKMVQPEYFAPPTITKSNKSYK